MKDKLVKRFERRVRTAGGAHLALPDDEQTGAVLTYCGLSPDVVRCLTNAIDFCDCEKCLDAAAERFGVVGVELR